jgi:hypothetical protein
MPRRDIADCLMSLDYLTTQADWADHFFGARMDRSMIAEIQAMVDEIDRRRPPLLNVSGRSLRNTAASRPPAARVRSLRWSAEGWEKSARSDDARTAFSLKRLGGRVWRSSRLSRGCSP